MKILRRFHCWLRYRHRIEWQTSMSPGGPPYWVCLCRRNMSIRHPVTGLRPRLTDTGWRYETPEEASADA